MKMPMALVMFLLMAVTAAAQSGAKNGEWRTYGGDLGITHLCAARPDQRG
jgi:hypothetical protein